MGRAGRGRGMRECVFLRSRVHTGMFFFREGRSINCRHWAPPFFHSVAQAVFCSPTYVQRVGRRQLL